MKRFALLFLIPALLFCRLSGQDIESWTASKKTLLYEKIYLQIDRELYAPGDFCWYKAYLVDGLTHSPLPGYKNVFVQLVSDSGKVLANRILLSQNGISHGEFLLADSLPDGEYTIRAYTKYLENFGEEACFHRKIWISGPKSSLELDMKPPPDPLVADVTFFPEGGDLVMNAQNHVAVKAVDFSGRGLDVRGYVTDEKDTLVATFRTGFMGMGRFILMPHEGKTYRARLFGYPEFSYQFDRIREKGLALHCEVRDPHVLFSVCRNYLATGMERLYLVASHKGIVLFYKEMVLDDFSQSFIVTKNNFPPGISKITLLNHDLDEMAERLVFISDTEESPLQVSLNKKEFHTREKAEVTISEFPEPGDTIRSFLSAAVVNKDYLTPGSLHFNMRSYLLLDSELRGPVESGASFFDNSENITAGEKLDLLLMVQGWRSYWWDDVTGHRQEELSGYLDAGLVVEGTVKSLLRKHLVVGGEVVLGPFSRNLLFEETRTDSLGRFRFDRLYLKDSTQVMINAKNEKERPLTEIILAPGLTFPDSVSPAAMKSTVRNLQVPLKFYRENYYRQLKMEEFNPEKGSILLGEMVVTGRYMEKPDGHFRMYMEPDNVLKITEDDFTYMSILDYLTGKVAGLVISGDEISIRGGSMPLFLLDGVKVSPEMVEDMIFRISMQDVDKIEILKSGANMAIFGSAGGNGVIAVYTRKGDVSKEINRYTKGQTVTTVRGYRTPAFFYSPKYTPENIDNAKPDYRPTLFWEPDIRTTNGKASIGFFTSDELAEYYLVVEGISRKGKIYFAAEEFSVTLPFSKTK